MDYGEMRLEYMALSEVMRLPRNPKMHDLPHLQASMGRFGFVAPPTLDENSGILAAGHGRLEVLEKMRDEGDDPPARVHARDDGEWMVPVVRGIAFGSERELEAYAIADNRLTEIGGWDYKQLAAIVSDLAAEGEGNLDGLGYEELELKRLLGISEEGDPAGFDPEERIKIVTCPQCDHEFVP